MQPAEKVRLRWIELYERVRDAGVVCRRCGISRPTLRKWWQRYQARCTAGLISRRRPRRFAQRKVFEREEYLIRRLRTQRQLVSKRLRNELLRVHGLRLSAATVHRALLHLDPNRLPLRRLQRHHRRRYSRRFLATACRWMSARLVPAVVSTPLWMIAAAIWWSGCSDAAPGQIPCISSTESGCDTHAFVPSCRVLNVTPHVAQPRTAGWFGARRPHREPSGSCGSQWIRKRVEETFGWMKTIGGLRRTRYRGRQRVQMHAYLTAPPTTC